MQNGLIEAFRWVRLRVGKLLVTGAILFVIWVAAGSPARADPLPVILHGPGEWFDSTNAAKHLSLVLPTENQPVVLKSTLSHGGKQLRSQDMDLGVVLLLSNVWTYSATNLSWGDFLKAHGVTNTPLVLDVPGSSGYYLLADNNRVLPFVGLSGQRTPEALWAWPKIPATFDGVIEGNADIANCGSISFHDKWLYLNGRIGRRGHGPRQSWGLTADGGFLNLRLTVFRDRDL